MAAAVLPAAAASAAAAPLSATDQAVNDRLGTRADMEQQLALMTDLSAEVKKASGEGKCFDPAVKEVRLPKYATLTGYEQNIEWVIHRYCGYWGRGI